MKLNELLEPLEQLADTLFDLVTPEPVKNEAKAEPTKQEEQRADSDEYERVEYFRKRKSKSSAGAKEKGSPAGKQESEGDKSDGTGEPEPGAE